MSGKCNSASSVDGNEQQTVFVGPAFEAVKSKVHYLS
jgi:hypothetical protein